LKRFQNVNIFLTGLDRNFDWKEPKIEKFNDLYLVTLFGDAITMMSLK